jgi:magnesium chelatase family protein
VLARVTTFSIHGLDVRPVVVEVDISRGLPAFTVVGLGDTAIREARERVRTALQNSGFEFPLARIVANLAPAHLRKGGSGFDLAIACGVLAASGQVPVSALERRAVFGELSLTGALRPCHGTLAVAEGARAAGLAGLLVARETATEAALVDELEVAGASTLRDVVEVLEGKALPQVPSHAASAQVDAVAEPDLADVRGHVAPIAALRIAAAGGHNLLLRGAPGTGKTMLARRLPGILPPLTRQEAIDVTRIHSVAGLHRGGRLVARRPFRAPHHTISASGLVGGGTRPAPGEASLAHHGVLFLAELSEVTRSALEALRQPLEDGRVAIVRGQHTAVFPTRFALVAATNPCPCGFGRGSSRCRCTDSDHSRHARRLSGPLIDRLDLVVDVEKPDAPALAGPPGTDSATIRAQVSQARERQAARLAGTGVACNAQMDPGLVRRHARLGSGAGRVLDAAYNDGRLSARGRDRALKVALTLADLEGRPDITPDLMHFAVSLRGEAQAEEGAA